MAAETNNKLMEVALRISEMREICGYTREEMAVKTGVSLEEYTTYETGSTDMPFTFIHKCATVFGIEITDLMEGHSARLTSYTVTRKGKGVVTAQEHGIKIANMAPLFSKKLAEPYWVRYDYDPQLENQPIHTTTHSGQEFDLVIDGSLKIQIGNHVEILNEGDSIYYNSSTPHGMIAVGGRPCRFVAMVMASDEPPQSTLTRRAKTATTPVKDLLCKKFVETEETPEGYLEAIRFKDADKYNFAFDTLDALADTYPDKQAMLHISKDMTERRFTFKQLRQEVCRTANYFTSLGIKKGDRVMLVLKRHYQFWFSILALNRIGAVAVPATNMLVAHDFEYRFNSAGISAIICTADGDTAEQAELALKTSPTVKTLVLVNGQREGWRDFNAEQPLFSTHHNRTEDSACGNDPMIMFFTSGTTGYPKIATHSFTYPLGHFVTAKYWHCVCDKGPHFTISDTGWGKAVWGKLYGQWLCEGCVFVYDFDRFDASVILPMFAKYNIATFCAPPTMYRMLIKEDLSKYDLSSIVHATTAGEALNPEVYRQFQAATGLEVMEGFGQTETTLAIANLVGSHPKMGSMGKASPMYDLHVLLPDGTEASTGETGEICVKAADGEHPVGLFLGYYRGEDKTAEVWHDGYYHTGDLAWADEDGHFYYVGRADDVIKSSGYRIGPFEIESVIMELPYVLECGVSAEPDEVRGQIVKASIVLVKGTEGTEELKKEIQEYVKVHTAPYKYPRKVVFRDELPKTISGKIQHNLL